MNGVLKNLKDRNKYFSLYEMILVHVNVLNVMDLW